MSIRWRLGLAVAQLAVLCLASYAAAGTYFPLSVWFVSGLLGVVLALQLTEPFFTRPTDVVVSGFTVIPLIAVSLMEPTVWAPAWWALGVYSCVGIAIAVVALVARGGATDLRGSELSYRAFQLVRAFAGKSLFSAVFLTSVLSEYYEAPTKALILIGAWAAVLLVSLVRWDQLLLGRGGSTRTLESIGIIAPARIVLTGQGFEFEPGAEIELTALGGRSVRGHVVRRLRRRRDILAEVQLADSSAAEAITGRQVRVRGFHGGAKVLGIVGPGTTDDSIIFEPLREVTMGSTVAGRATDGQDILYQINGLQIVSESTSGDGAEELVRAFAAQVGVVTDDGSIVLSRRVLQPGTVINTYSGGGSARSPERDAADVELGCLLGTDLPVWMNTDTAASGHMAILGMTGMGKSAFAKRLAAQLAERFPVVVVDQTGEYRGMGLPASTPQNASQPGLSLKDLETSTTPHKEALAALRILEALGRTEFAAGSVQRRVLILEEAHQFVPEPSMLGFNVPGRDEAIQFGLLMMQVRKFGVSVILISQRTAVVAKSALSQCENIIAFKSVDQTGLDYLEAFGGPTARHLLPRLQKGEAILMGPSISIQTAVGVKLTHELESGDPSVVEDQVL